jgi:hypothetical protein
MYFCIGKSTNIIETFNLLKIPKNTKFIPKMVFIFAEFVHVLDYCQKMFDKVDFSNWLVFIQQYATMTKPPFHHFLYTFDAPTLYQSCQLNYYSIRTML